MGMRWECEVQVKISGGMKSFVDSGNEGAIDSVAPLAPRQNALGGGTEDLLGVSEVAFAGRGLSRAVRPTQWIPLPFTNQCLSRCRLRSSFRWVS